MPNKFSIGDKVLLKRVDKRTPKHLLKYLRLDHPRTVIATFYDKGTQHTRYYLGTNNKGNIDLRQIGVRASQVAFWDNRHISGRPKQKRAYKRHSSNRQGISSVIHRFGDCENGYHETHQALFYMQRDKVLARDKGYGKPEWICAKCHHCPYSEDIIKTLCSRQYGIRTLKESSIPFELPSSLVSKEKASCVSRQDSGEIAEDIRAGGIGEAGESLSSRNPARPPAPVCVVFSTDDSPQIGQGIEGQEFQLVEKRVPVPAETAIAVDEQLLRVNGRQCVQ